MRKKHLLAAFATASLIGASVAWSPIAEAAGSIGQTTVTYRGYQLAVPAEWPVIRLDEHPGTCVRFDRHAVYLGRPSANPVCPARAIGRSEALLIEPLIPGAAGDAYRQPRIGPPRLADLSAETDHETSFAVPPAGVAVTASFGESPEHILHILDSARVTSTAFRTSPPSPREPGSGGTIAAAGVVPGAYTGPGFDACTAPSSAAMQSWLSSPYRGIGVYIGGVSRACAQPNLTAGWVSTQVSRGWHILPIYVGHQAPCQSRGTRINPSIAAAQGRADADDAVAQASGLGMTAGSVLYNDMEHYDRTDSACRTAVLTFLSAWTNRLHEWGYRSGVYSSASSGITDLVATYSSPTYARPDHIWIARWDGVPTTSDPAVPADYWADHQRIKQYRGGHPETHGGVTINIDSNYLDVNGSGGGPGLPWRPLCHPVTGDWDGDGDVTLGVACKEGIELKWGLMNANIGGSPQVTGAYGNADVCVPITGDWNGDGRTSGGVACKDGLDIVWSLSNGFEGSPSYPVFRFGNADVCRPVTGDWDGNGTDTIGVACKEGIGMSWGLMNFLGGGSPQITGSFGNSDFCRPVTGDWDGNGTDTIGVACKEGIGMSWGLINGYRGSPSYPSFGFGNADRCRSVTGDWDGNGTDTIGVACQDGHGLSWGMMNFHGGGSPQITAAFGSGDWYQADGGWNGPGWPAWPTPA